MFLKFVKLDQYYSDEEIALMASVFHSYGHTLDFLTGKSYRVDSLVEMDMITGKMPLSEVPLYINYFKTYNKSGEHLEQLDDRVWLGMLATFRLKLGR